MRYTALLLLVLLLSLHCLAQDTVRVKSDTTNVYKVSGERAKKTGETAGPAEKRFYYGGYFNLTFGSYTVIGIEPLLAWKFTPKLSAGGILTYEYISDNTMPGYHYNSSNYGASLFARYRLFPMLYFHTEFSEMNYQTNYSDGFSERNWVPFLFVGGGYSMPVSKNTWMNAQILFDVIQNEHSPYADWAPFYSVGFGVGF